MCYKLLPPNWMAAFCHVRVSVNFYTKVEVLSTLLCTALYVYWCGYFVLIVLVFTIVDNDDYVYATVTGCEAVAWGVLPWVVLSYLVDKGSFIRGAYIRRPGGLWCQSVWPEALAITHTLCVYDFINWLPTRWLPQSHSSFTQSFA